MYPVTASESLVLWEVGRRAWEVSSPSWDLDIKGKERGFLQGVLGKRGAVKSGARTGSREKSEAKGF